MRKKVEFERVSLIRPTEAAWLIQIDGKNHWFPKALCEFEETGTMMGTLTIPEWMAIEKGLV